MDNARSTPGLFQRLRARPVAAADAADLGTAYGLEVSLDQQLVRSANPADPAARGPGWVQRLATRARSLSRPGAAARLT